MNRRLATLFASLLIATLPAIGQTPQPKFPKPGTRVGLAEWKPTQQEVVASYWSLEPGWNTELEIRNNLAERQLTVTPVLGTAAGRETALPDVVLASDEVTSINLQLAVAQAAPELLNRMGSFGSAAVKRVGSSRIGFRDYSKLALHRPRRCNASGCALRCHSTVSIGPPE